MTSGKKAVVDNVVNQSAKLIDISNQIWAAEETAFEEHSSAKLLADYAEANGFKVERKLNLLVDHQRTYDEDYRNSELHNNKKLSRKCSKPPEAKYSF